MRSDAAPFGDELCQARERKGYTQRQLAALVGVHYTYLSKLERDRAGYPPSREVIHQLAVQLALPEEELRLLSGRIPPDAVEIFQDLFREYPQMPALLLRLRDEPKFARWVFEQLGGD